MTEERKDVLIAVCSIVGVAVFVLGVFWGMLAIIGWFVKFLCNI